MIEEYFNLLKPPFKLSADPHFYYDSESHRKAMAYLQYGLQQAEGFVVVTGDAGVGKSMLVEQLKLEIEEANIALAFIQTGHIERGEALDYVLSAYRLEPQGSSAVAKMEALEAFLSDQYAYGRQALLIVDEAQHLTRDVLEEFRILTNLSVDGAPLLQIFLVGQTELKETLSTPEMEQFRQRVIASCHLGALDEEEAAAYVDHRLASAGWEDDESAFTDVAHQLIYSYTKGVPRKINKLCSRLLLQTALDKKDFVDGATVRKVVEELQSESLNQNSGFDIKTDFTTPTNKLTAQVEDVAPVPDIINDDNVVPFAPSSALKDELEEAMQPLEEITLEELDVVNSDYSSSSGPHFETSFDKKPTSPSQEDEAPKAETVKMTERRKTPRPIDAIASVMDNLGKRKKPIQDLSAQDLSVIAGRANEPLTPTADPDLELPDTLFENDLPDDQPAASSLEEIAEQISANLDKEEELVLDDEDRVFVDDVTPLEEFSPDDELPLITSIGTGTTPAMNGVKQDLADFVADLRENLMATQQHMSVVRDRVEQVDTQRQERNLLISRKLHDVEILLQEMRGER